MLRPPDVAAAADLDLEQADLAHALEVGAHGVGVQPERLGDLGGGERPRRAGELEVDRVAGVVAERLEQVELRRARARPRPAVIRSRSTTGDYTDFAGKMPHMAVTSPVEQPLEPPAPPTVDDVMARARHGHRPRARRRHRVARHGAVGRRRARRRSSPSASSSPSAAARCAPRSRRTSRPGSSVHPGVTDVKIVVGRDDRRGTQPGDDQGPLERTRERPRHRGAAVVHGCSPSPAARAASASARSPSTSPPRSRRRAHRRRARRRHLGLLGAPHARHLERLEAPTVDGADKPKIIPNERVVGARPAQGRVDGLPRRRGHRADVAGPDAHQGRRAVPPRRRSGATSTTCSSTCRPAPATCRWAWPACCRAPR